MQLAKCILCIINISCITFGNDALSILTLQQKRDSLSAQITIIDKQLAEIKLNQSANNDCGPYWVSYSPEHRSIRARPFYESPYISAFARKDSFQVLSVYEYNDETYYGISDGKQIGFITGDMVISGLLFDKEKCILLSTLNNLKSRYTDGVYITSINVSEPNSASGININIGLHYFSPNRVIKYIKFLITPYNQVGDSVYCSITHKSSITLSLTGPIKDKDGETGHIWENCWYNQTITCAKLKQVSIVFMDGSSKTYSRNINAILINTIPNTCTYSKH